MSARSPPAKYPQELTLECAPSRVTHLQLMSHHANISRKVEIFVRSGGGGSAEPNATSPPWSRVGFFTLDSNVRSHFKTRELRTVNLPLSAIPVSQLRLLLHAPHINGLNTYGQVGIVAINAIGHAFVSASPSRGPASPSTAGLALVDITVDTLLDGDCASLLRQLLVAKARAINREEYGLAKRLKGFEAELKRRGVELAQISAAKRRAVQEEDFDTAMKAQADMLEIRGELLRMMRPVAGIIAPVGWRPDGAASASSDGPTAAAAAAMTTSGRISSAPTRRTVQQQISPLPPPYGAPPVTTNQLFAPRSGPRKIGKNMKTGANVLLNH